MDAIGFECVDKFDGGELSRLVGVTVYACPECGATWNAGDQHMEDCSRRPAAQYDRSGDDR